MVECRPSDIIPVEDGQAFLLCSDGFWELILENVMLTSAEYVKMFDFGAAKFSGSSSVVKRALCGVALNTVRTQITEICN